MLMIIDNYDSFVYNIVHYIDYPEEEIVIVRNDKINVGEIGRSSIDAIIISPGPMSPKEAGVSNDIIRLYGSRIPMLGVCLGHQCIGHVFGCRVERNDQPTHGRTSPILLKKSALYEGLGDTIEATRYHSLYIASEHFNNEELMINATLQDGTIMGVQHRKYPIYGVQFHPESILTGDCGKKILSNFIHSIAGLKNESHETSTPGVECSVG